MSVPEKHHPILIPVIAITAGFTVGSAIMLVSGFNPLDIFKSLVRAVLGWDIERGTFNPRYIGEYLVAVMPLILTGLSVAFAFRTGLFNIGGEGQFLVGAFASVAVGILVKAPGVIHLPLALLAGFLAGALWGFVPGVLKAMFNVHEVVVTIMMNYTALYMTNYCLQKLPGGNSSRTPILPESATLKSEFLMELTNKSRLHWGFIVVILMVLLFWFIIDKTTFGYELKAVGFNQEASKYAGMKVKRNISFSMALAGSFAGLGGSIVALGTFGYGRVLPAFENYGFDGIAVALVGGSTALGSVFGGFLLGGLKAVQPLMQARGIPRDIAVIIISVIILFVAMQRGIGQLIVKFFAKPKGEE